MDHILSGHGLLNICHFVHDAFGNRTLITPAAFVPARTCVGVGTIDDPANLPQAISRSALEKRCAQCVESLDLFIAAYGAEAGNLALRTAATACLYGAGGVAPD